MRLTPKTSFRRDRIPGPFETISTGPAGVGLEHTFTLPLGLDFYRSGLGGTAWHYLMAASCLSTLPLVVLFFCLQKFFLRGLCFMKSID